MLSRPSIHQVIIKLMKELGYLIDENGVCKGIVGAALRDAFAHGDLKRFNEFILKTYNSQNLSTTIKTTLKEYANSLQNKQYDDESKEEAQKAADILAQLDRIALFQDGSTLYKGWFNSYISLESLELLMPFTFPDHDYRLNEELAKPSFITKIESWANVYSKKDIESLFIALNIVLEKNPLNIALTFAGPLLDGFHAIGLFYDSQTQHWCLIDANQLKTPTENNTSEFSALTLIEKSNVALLTDFIRTAFNCEQPYTLLKSSMFSLTAQKEQSNAFLNALYNDVPHFKQLKNITANKASFIDPLNKESLAHAIASTNDINAMEELIALGGNINAQINNENTTPLLLAIQEKQIEMVNLLLSKNARIDLYTDTGITPLLIASETGDLNLTRTLIKHQASINMPSNNHATPLLYAAEDGHINIAKKLIKKGAIYIPHVNGETPLLHAAKNGHEEMVKLLLNTFPMITKEDLTASFICATQMGHLEIVKALIAHDAALINARNEDEISAIIFAASNGNTDIVKFLIENGADFNEDNEISPLLAAAELDQLQTVQYLLEKNANINIQDDEGTTPLLIAIEEGHLKLASFLLEKNADPNLARDSDDSTPLSVAMENGYVIPNLNWQLQMFKQNGDKTDPLPLKKSFTPT